MRVFWTDGSAVPNPGAGGYAVIDEATKNPVALGRGDKTTNIRMEGFALRAAMQLAGDEPCEIHTDSEFWVNALTKWAPGWEKDDWKKGKKTKKKPIQNVDIVKSLFELYREKKVKLIWVRSHIGTELNEKADEWANRARTGETFEGLELEFDEGEPETETENQDLDPRQGKLFDD